MPKGKGLRGRILYTAQNWSDATLTLLDDWVVSLSFSSIHVRENDKKNR